jgi:hypothetical protein
MNVHLHPVSFKKYSLILIYSFFIIAIMAWSMELYFERLYGDLTRVGNFPERYFGWQAPQPLIPSGLYKDYSLAEADIIVIGDSFSFTRNWQTRLIADGLKVSTLYYTAESLPNNLGEALRTAGFRGRYVIIEKVERTFQIFMKSLDTQQHPIVKRDIIVDSSFPLYPFTRRERISLDKLNGGDWGFKALYNSIKLFLKLPDKYLKSGWVQAINFDGCQLFSHRLCNYALFIESDFKKETFNSIANVLTVNKSLQSAGIQAIWMIVPDKATVYLGYGTLNQYPYQNIWQQFAQYPELIAPDLGAAFILKSHTIKDFYLPNDTHLSTNGFLYLGDYMTQVIRNIKAK